MKRIAVVGSTMIDMITYVQRVPDAGQTVIGDSFVLGFGGKGANQAVMASRLGAQVSMVNTLGDDLFGDNTLQNFENEQIDTTYVERVPGSSGVAPIWVEPNGTNRIICVAAANEKMTTAQAQRAIAGIKDLGAVIGQFEIPQKVTAAAFRKARELGVPTIFNPAPSQTITEELLEVCDWIIPNENEFADLHPSNELPSSDEVIKNFARHFKKRVVVTLGEKGAVLVGADGTLHRISAPRVDARDTTGAGDAFVGAFAYGIANGFSEIDAVVLGCKCASMSVTRLGTQVSYPSRDEAQSILKILTTT